LGIKCDLIKNEQHEKGWQWKEEKQILREKAGMRRDGGAELSTS
jgi:hypothetical protein